MLLTAAAYLLTTVLLFAMGWYVAHREQRIILQGNSKGLPFSSWEIWVIIVMFALIAGFRNYSSADMMMYHNQYTIYGIWGYFTRQLELGFSQVIVLFSSLGLHYYVFSVFWSAIEITLILYALRHKKQLYPWILFYVMCGPFFTYWMDQMRQIVVACVLLAMTPLIVKRRFWPFLMISLLCMFIHRSAWMMIPLYFVNRIHWLEKFNLKWVYGILAACIVIGLYPIWVRCFGSLSWICPYIGYEKYVRAVTALSLFDAHFLISQFASVIYVSNLLLSAIILWHVPAIRRYYKNDLYVDVTFTFFLAWTFVSNLLYCAPFLLIRPFDFFKLYSLPCVAFFLNYAYQNKRYSLLAVSLLLAGVSTYVSVGIFLTPLP